MAGPPHRDTTSGALWDVGLQFFTWLSEGYDKQAAAFLPWPGYFIFWLLNRLSFILSELSYLLNSLTLSSCGERVRVMTSYQVIWLS